MNGHERGDVADGGENLLAGGFRYRQALFTGDLSDTPMIIVDADNLDPGGSLLMDGNVVGGDGLGKTNA